MGDDHGEKKEKGSDVRVDWFINRVGLASAPRPPCCPRHASVLLMPWACLPCPPHHGLNEQMGQDDKAGEADQAVPEQ